MTREYTGKLSPVDYVLSQNLHRRHLTASQKAMVAAAALPLYEAEAKERQGKRNDLIQQAADMVKDGKLRPMTAGALIEVAQREGRIPEHGGNISTMSAGKARDKAADAVGVNPRYVSDAKKLIEDAPEVAELPQSRDRTATRPPAIRAISLAAPLQRHAPPNPPPANRAHAL